MRRSVVPLVRARNAIVGELVAHRRPSLPAVVRALDDLSEPAARLRRKESIRIGRRRRDEIDLPPRVVLVADIPLLSLAVRRENECALPCADENSCAAHVRAPPLPWRLIPFRRRTGIGEIDKVPGSGPNQCM